MKNWARVFVKWLKAAAVFIGIITIIGILGTPDYESSRNINVISVFVIGSIFLAAFFTLTELRIIPWHARRQKRKIEKYFNALFVSDNVAEFTWNGKTVYVHYYTRLVMAEAGSSDFVEFHIKKEDAGKKQLNSKFECRDSKIGSVDTFIIASTNSLGLKRIKRKFNKYES